MIKHITAIMKNEFIHLIRDPRSLVIAVFLPIILLFVFGYAVSFDIKNLQLAIFDDSKTLQSRQLIDKFMYSGYFVREADLTSEKQFGDELDSGRAKVILSIPYDFAKKILSNRTAVIQVIVDGSDPTNASSALSYINGIAQQYFSGLLVKRTMLGSATPVKLASRIWYNEDLRSLNFFIPGLISTILMILAAALTSLTIVSEKEQGTMEALVVSPIRKNELMIGKILPYIIIAFWDVVFVTAMGRFWFLVPMRGSIFLMLLCSCVFLTSALGIGLLFSTIARTSQEAVLMALLTTLLPSILLSGMVFPIENMPVVIQWITFIVPARYFIRILRAIFLKGVGLSHIWLDVLLLTVLTGLLLSLCIRAFKKRID